MTDAPGTLPDLEALGLFLTVAESGSVGAAARRLGISQPTASQRLRVLERRMGMVLLERSPAGSALSEDGHLVAEWATRLVADGARFSRNVAALSRRHGSHLQIAASLTIAEHLVPGWLGTLAAADPELTVAVKPANSDRVAELVRSGQADLGFVEGAGPPERLQSVVVGRDDLVVVVSPEHPWARREGPVTPYELISARLILRESGSGTRQVLDRALEARGLAVAPAMELGSTSLITGSLTNGTAASVLSRLSVAADLSSGRLVEVGLELGDDSLQRDLRAVWATGRAPRGAVSTLLRLVTRG